MARTAYSLCRLQTLRDWFSCSQAHLQPASQYLATLLSAATRRVVREPQPVANFGVNPGRWPGAHRDLPGLG